MPGSQVVRCPQSHVGDPLIGTSGVLSHTPDDRVSRDRQPTNSPFIIPHSPAERNRSHQWWPSARQGGGALTQGDGRELHGSDQLSAAAISASAERTVI